MGTPEVPAAEREGCPCARITAACSLAALAVLGVLFVDRPFTPEHGAVTHIGLANAAAFSVPDAIFLMPIK